MKIGKIDFNKKLGGLTFKNFKRFWEDGNFEQKTGVNFENAARRLGVKMPRKKIEENKGANE